MQDEELLTVDEAAQIMKVHPKTVRAFVQSGELAKVPIGKREYRIRRVEVNRFIREKESRGNIHPQ
jgi:excisionase family DNA binding protein